MNLRSRGNTSLTPFIDNINRIKNPKKRLDFNNNKSAIMNDNQNQQNNIPHANGGVDMNAPIEAQGVQQNARVINANDAPNNYNSRQGIAPPAIQRNDYDFNNNILQPIQSKLFHGFPTENPIKHLLNFERICDLHKMNGVSEDALKLRLFPFSLGEPASEWESELEPGTITTWDKCKKEFLARFYTPNRTGNVRTQITSFAQGQLESFSEAWDRLKKYLNECPHHNFGKDTLLSTFYRGLKPEDRRMLDTSSGGNFLMTTVGEGWGLIEKLAKADAAFNPDFDRSNRKIIGKETANEITMQTLKEQMDKLLRHQNRTYEVNMVSDNDAFQEEEIQYLQNNYKGPQQPFYQNRQHPNFSYRSTNVANPQDQNYPPMNQQYQQKTYVSKPQFNNNYQQGFQQQHSNNQHNQEKPDYTSMLDQIIKDQAASAAAMATLRSDLTQQIDDFRSELGSKVEQLTSRVQYLEGHHASSSNSNAPGQLPGKAIKNPKEYNVSTLLHIFENKLEETTEDSTITEDSNFSEEGVDPKEEEKAEVEVEVEEEKVEVEVEEEKVEVEVEVEKEEVEVKIEKVKKDKGKEITNHHSRKSGSSQIWVKKENLDKKKMFLPKQIQIKEPKLPEKIIKVKGKNYSQVKPMLEKLGDPGLFTIPCFINETIFENCMCDLGASISLMPLSVANRIGLTNYEPSKVSVVLADRTVMTPHGMIKDVPIRMGKVIIPTDFIIVDMDEEPKDPILLGRPFMATTGAVLDVRCGIIELDLGKDYKFTFDLDGVGTIPRMLGQPFIVKGADEENEGAPHKTIYPANLPNEEEHDTIEGESLRSLFGDQEESSFSSWNRTRYKAKKTCDLIFELRPIGETNGSMEYKVIGGRSPNPYEIAEFHMTGYKRALIPPGPFKVKKIFENGSIALTGTEKSKLPYYGQKVKLYQADTKVEFKALSLGPEYDLKPFRVVNGTIEYRTRGVRVKNPFYKVKQILNSSHPEEFWSGLIAVKENAERGTITLVGLRKSDPPYKERKVKVYLVTEAPKEDTSVPLIPDST